ncbi:FAD-dependent oxidoreductase [Silvanigrella aquatica]|uniref:FAD dependent oxidoreductase domain-containing protein n=1 Tax=Silvanigrella aquatica TaxID=1915309 RepID=A0A1L4D3F5_9BACT|nr:FAD-dependent oxidoreductase [Silvanigrella aquatica]APJ04721.1 hypothetical protein AXG55_12740 [Silvanigrella aquatica]
MTKIIIVGSGIVGLSVAEFLSRKNSIPYQIEIISNEHPHSGSYAAAANLATKGQLFARDNHFNLKLQAKKNYFNWLSSLITEVNSNISIARIYKNGCGVDYFTSQENRDKHYARVRQSDLDLKNRSLSLKSIVKEGNHKIIYEEESWVNASSLLALLQEVLTHRGVKFFKSTFGYHEYQNILQSNKNIKLIICAGAWSKDLIANLNLSLPESMKKKQRLTLGSTFYGENVLKNYNENFIIHEIVSENLKEKVTFSGNNDNYYISSSTLKVENVSDFDENLLSKKNKNLLELSKINLADSPFLSADENLKISKRDGFRVGYGHSEIVLEKLNAPGVHMSVYVCAGAHKSGYLFAPVLGAMLQEML